MAISKRSTLFIGAGACGGKQIDEIMDLDSRYNCMYFNTSAKDVRPRKYANMDKNVYCIPFMDGSGRERAVTKKAVQENISSILDFTSSFENMETIFIVGSMAGGTGGASIVPITVSLVRMFKSDGKNIKVIPVFTKPCKTDSKKLLENAIECWEDIKKMYDKSNPFKPDSIIFLDNDKFDTEEEVNKAFARDIDDAISLSAGEGENVIDSGDLGKVMTARGVMTILRLDEEVKDDIELALRIGLENSPYSNYCDDEDCKYLCVSLKSELAEYEDGSIEEELITEYKFNDIKNAYFIHDDFYKGTNTRDNIVIVSGQELPEAMITELRQSLKEKKDEILKRRILRKEREKNEVKTLKRKVEVARKEETPKKKRKVMTGTSKDFDDLLDDGKLDSFFE